MNRVLLLMVACFLLWMPRAVAAHRVAIVGTDSGAEIVKLLDLAITEFSHSKTIEVLERAQIEQVLREQEVSLGNGVADAERAVKAGRLLRADLFAVLEGGGPQQPFGVVVFDGQTGVRYADTALVASNVLSAAREVARVVEQAAQKLQRRSTDLRTVGVLSVRNADLPRSFDSVCETIGRLLERELVASPGVAVLERRRLEQINRERGVVNGAGEALLPSMRLLEMEMTRDGQGLRANAALSGLDGKGTVRTNVSVPTMDAAGLSRQLTRAVLQLLNTRAAAVEFDRSAEARRFGREAELLTAHRDYAPALRALEAAYALNPADTNLQFSLVRLLPAAAIEYIDPGGQRWQRALKRKPSDDELAQALALGHRGADLLRDFCLEAAAVTDSEKPISKMMAPDAYEALGDLMEKLADRLLKDTPSKAESDSLSRKERDIRIEIIEPCLRARVHDAKSFERFGSSLFWLTFNPHLGAYNETQFRCDAALVLERWLPLAERYNPLDGSGNYTPLYHATYGGYNITAAREAALFDEVWSRCERSADPVLRAYAKFGRAMPGLKKANYPSDETLRAERALRLWLQNEIAQLPATETNRLRDRLFGMLDQALVCVMNHREDWREYLEACQFALEQREARPGLFSTSLLTLSTPRNHRTVEVYPLAVQILKLLDERPEAFSERDRNQCTAICCQYRDRFAPELTSATNSPLRWTRAVKLFEPSPKRDGVGWLFKPVVSNGAVYVAGLGLDGENFHDEALQLVRIPLDGKPVSLLGRVGFHGLFPDNLHSSVENAWKKRSEAMSFLFDGRYLPRAACVVSNKYLLATHLGVFAFPMAGGPVEVLCGTNGLPSDEVHSLAVLKGKLYVGAGELNHAGYLVEYDLAAKTAKTLASSRRKEIASPFDDQPPFYPAFLWADEARYRILMLAATSRSNSVSGLWSFTPATSEFRQLAPYPLRSVASYWVWGGEVAPTAIGVFQISGFLALWDTRTDQFILNYHRTNQETSPRWPARHVGGGSTLYPPVILHDGWLWWANPLQRASLDGTKLEEFPPLPDKIENQRTEFLQLLDDGKRVLVADRTAVWLLELRSEEH